MNQRMLPTGVTLAAIVIAAVAGFHLLTDGFHAVTSGQLRQRAFSRTPQQLPAVALVDSRGQTTNLRAITGARQTTVVTLIYTECTSLCLLNASSEAYLQARFREADLQDQVGLLTISFDPSRDTPEVLASYARRVKADPGAWNVATVADPADLDPLLDAFGVVVLPDGAGGYTHNGALFLVDRRGRLIDALDPDAADQVVERLAARAHVP
jgi:protein SCO1/2